jgi:transposase InsO family protein
LALAWEIRPCKFQVSETVGGEKYGYSRWMDVHMLKSKDQALAAFVKYKAQAENESDCRIKIVRSDRVGEFLNGEFTSVCDEAGIKRQFTTPYTPQQNGVVGRRNRTVMEMARAMLKSMKVLGRY